MAAGICRSGPSEFVRILREGSWFDSGCTDEEYIVNFSGRYRELHGVTVRTDTPEQFMDDLKKYGYIRAEKPVPFIVTLPAGLTWTNRDFSFHRRSVPVLLSPRISLSCQHEFPLSS